MRRALGRQLAAMRNRAGLSQWDLAPLTGYSRSTLSDAELGRHRLRREFWLRCDALLKADGRLVTAYDRIETAAAVISQRARSTAQLARDQHASARLQAVLVAGGGTAGAGRRKSAGPARRAGPRAGPRTGRFAAGDGSLPALPAADRCPGRARRTMTCPGRGRPGPGRPGPLCPHAGPLRGPVPPCNYMEDTCVRTSAGRYWEASVVPDTPNLEVIRGSRAASGHKPYARQVRPASASFDASAREALAAARIQIHTGDINEHEVPDGTVSSASGQRGFLP